ncbi:hypothetical protein CHS0354_030765 [Potamilus streckersoni]|uniref:EGF-like domain-containing protein n=1 Tax=Potamilus streckersoni TaxID=2493646 RepID=A0AAE0TE59_9BIVA|nr:hypothetical protein CHS0354_030765 [Potamilus streckersoni]
MTYKLKYSSILMRSAFVWTDVTNRFLGALSVSRTFTIFWLLLFTKTIDCSTSKCQVCKDIVKEFHEGIRKTSKSNFGGGNTHWEEKSLGSYATSETRLVEIMEGLCEHAEKECHTMVEAHEETIEKYWFAFFAKKKDKDLHLWLCIENIKVCCPENTYGPNCQPCPGDQKNPCKGNGRCDGEGNREGTGKCTCNAGYKGDLCDECTDGYYEESKNQTHTSCKACHESCKSTCWEAGPKGCDECKNGWTHSEEEGCVDVNECEKTPCEENEYCLNNDGSYSCEKCHSACDRCRGYGADNCEECKDGYELKDSLCTDKDECAVESSPCIGSNEICVNTQGSYSCSCQEGFTKENGECILKPKEESESAEAEKEGKEEL